MSDPLFSVGDKDYITKLNQLHDQYLAAVAAGEDAQTQAATAATQAGIATTQAGIATTQAGIATTQAGNAVTAQGLAEAAQAAAEEARDGAVAAWTAALAANLDMNLAARMNPSTITEAFAIPSGYNAYSAGPLTIGEGVEVTLNDHSIWSIL